MRLPKLVVVPALGGLLLYIAAASAQNATDSPATNGTEPTPFPTDLGQNGTEPTPFPTDLGQNGTEPTPFPTNLGQNGTEPTVSPTPSPTWYYGSSSISDKVGCVNVDIGLMRDPYCGYETPTDSGAGPLISSYTLSTFREEGLLSPANLTEFYQQALMHCGNINSTDCHEYVGLPWPFTLYGESYYGIFLNEMGVVSFNSHTMGFMSPQEGLPHGYNIPSAYIAPLWTSLSVAQCGSVYWNVVGDPQEGEYLHIIYLDVCLEGFEQLPLAERPKVTFDLVLAQDGGATFGTMAWAASYYDVVIPDGYPLVIGMSGGDLAVASEVICYPDIAPCGPSVSNFTHVVAFPYYTYPDDGFVDYGNYTDSGTTWADGTPIFFGPDGSQLEYVEYELGNQTTASEYLLSANATQPLYLSDDQYEIVSIGFDFPFLGGLNYTHAAIFSNGLVALGNLSDMDANSLQSMMFPDALPDPRTFPFALLAPLWMDLNPPAFAGSSITAWWGLKDGFPVFGVRFADIATYSGNLPMNFDVLLSPDGSFSFEYGWPFAGAPDPSSSLLVGWSSPNLGMDSSSGLNFCSTTTRNCVAHTPIFSSLNGYRIEAHPIPMALRKLQPSSRPSFQRWLRPHTLKRAHYRPLQPTYARKKAFQQALKLMPHSLTALADVMRTVREDHQSRKLQQNEVMAVFAPRYMDSSPSSGSGSSFSSSSSMEYLEWVPLGVDMVNQVCLPPGEWSMMSYYNGPYECDLDILFCNNEFNVGEGVFNFTLTEEQGCMPSEFDSLPVVYLHNSPDSMCTIYGCAFCGDSNRLEYGTCEDDDVVIYPGEIFEGPLERELTLRWYFSSRPCQSKTILDGDDNYSVARIALSPPQQQPPYFSSMSATVVSVDNRWRAVVNKTTTLSEASPDGTERLAKVVLNVYFTTAVTWPDFEALLASNSSTPGNGTADPVLDFVC